MFTAVVIESQAEVMAFCTDMGRLGNKLLKTPFTLDCTQVHALLIALETEVSAWLSLEERVTAGTTVAWLWTSGLAVTAVD
ncbi:MAG: hypothetical protein ABSG86_29815 [Thermoguttaceae bacterium]